MNQDDRPGSQGMEILVNQPSQSQRTSCQCHIRNNNADHIVSSSKATNKAAMKKNQAGRIRFDDKHITHDIIGYANHYDKHPRHMLAAANRWITVGKTRCKYTGPTADKLSRRISKDRTLRKRERSMRRQIMQQMRCTSRTWWQLS